MVKPYPVGLTVALGDHLEQRPLPKDNVEMLRSALVAPGMVKLSSYGI